MSTKWAMPIPSRINDIRVNERRRAREERDCTEDKKMKYCNNCNQVFQLKMFIDRRENIQSITILEDFPTIGKLRVDSCLNCESKSE